MIARTPVHSSKIERERERERAPTNERGTERRSIFPRTFQPLVFCTFAVKLIKIQLGFLRNFSTVNFPTIHNNGAVGFYLYK